MKLFIRRNISADKIAFTVFDEQGFEKYNIIPVKKKEHSGFNIISNDEKVVCKARKMPIATVNTYLIKIKSRRVTFVCVPVSDSIKCHFYGVNWHITGNAISKNYGILDVDNSIIATHKTVMSDYEFNVFDKANELIAIATSICIDLINTVDNRATQAV